jgi:outer membrane protein
VVLALQPVGALADDLRAALTAAYQTNPDLQAARDNLRATDENVPLARASALPSLAGSVNYNNYIEKGGSSRTSNPDRVMSATANAGLPLYSGGAVKNGVAAAKTRVEAGRASLRGTESSVFTNTVTAYMDVIRDAAIVGLQKNNVQVLEVNLQATSDRFEIGDVTRTDVAQSRSRLALARASLRSGRGQPGGQPRDVCAGGRPCPACWNSPRRWRACPATLTGPSTMRLTTTPIWPPRASRARPPALTSRSPQPAASRRSRQSRPRRTSTIWAVHWAVAQCHRNPGQRRDRLDPLFQGGAPARACVRRGHAERDDGAGNRRRAAGDRHRALGLVVLAGRAGSDRAEPDGGRRGGAQPRGRARGKHRGNRTILNILDAEQELLNAQVQLVTAQRNEYVAGFALLSAMGKAQARDLGLDGGALYDPASNYERVHHRIWDWDSDPAPKAQATATVDTPAQDATIPDQPLP